MNNSTASKRCLGFGMTEGKCTNLAGCKHSPYWCEECNKERMDHIGSQINSMVEKLRNSDE